MSKVVCAISGGVDSAIAALLLRKKGFNVVGAFMKNWDLRDETGHCSTEEDFNYAERVCRTLNIPFHEIDFVKEYWTDVFQETLKEYEMGNTPNPDVLCNKYIKFNAFYKYAKNQLGIPVIATGHYARTSENFLSSVSFPANENEESRVCGGARNDGFLYKALDQGKDQTFFLNRISSDVLKHTIFPIGGFRKKTVRDLACENGLEFVAKRKESMGICFIGLRDFNKFIEDYILPRDGSFICLETGEYLGKHNGYFKYTLGQRSRLAVKNIAFFVAGKNISTGDVYVVPGTLHHALFSNAFITEEPHWIKDSSKAFQSRSQFDCGVRVMHREPIVGCKVNSLSDGRYLMILDYPLRSITPGQSAVIYSGFKCLGGAKICNVGPSSYESRNGFPQFCPYREDRDIWSSIWENFGNDVLPCGDGVSDHINKYNQVLDKYTYAITR